MRLWKILKIICNEIADWYTKSRRRIIADSSNDIFLSIASLWEIAIKISIGKLILVKPLTDVIKQLDVENIKILTILPEHTLQVSTLSFHHKDPFDRIIIAQSQVENLSIMTEDGEFVNYKVEIL